MELRPSILVCHQYENATRPTGGREVSKSDLRVDLPGGVRISTSALIYRGMDERKTEGTGICEE